MKTVDSSKFKMLWKTKKAAENIKPILLESRGINKYRFDILNCYPQSYVENCTLWGNYKVYTIKMIKMLGQDKVEEMLNDKQSVSYNQIRYENHIQEWYKFIVEKKELIEKNS